MTSTAELDRLRVAVIDGRVDNVRYRQNELQKLHQALTKNAEKFRIAISQDGRGDTSSEVSAEAEAEYSRIMSAVREFYLSLNFKKLLHDEYLITNELDNLERRVGKGLVVIKPTTHTRLYSIVCPIAAAITAGNCVCLELEATLSNVDRILKEVLPKTLDIDTFLITTKPVQDLSSVFVVDQRSDNSNPALNQLISNPLARSIAIVDRAADIDQAAKSVVNARFSFQGTSPYSPDVVLVNDFVKASFMEACVKYASKFHTTAKQSSRAQTISTQKMVKDAEAKGQITSFGSTGFTLIDIKDRNSTIAKIKLKGCFLAILECTSLLDALMHQKSESPLLAAYLFSDPPTAKFLAQHLNATRTYVNHIPVHLLIGPSAPTSLLHATSSHKYIPEMFSSPQVQQITPPVKDLEVLERLLDSSSKGRSDEVLISTIRKQSEEPLPSTGQPVGHAVGFFEQGIFIGVGLFLSVAIPIVTYGSYVLGRGVWMFARRV